MTAVFLIFKVQTCRKAVKLDDLCPLLGLYWVFLYSIQPIQNHGNRPGVINAKHQRLKCKIMAFNFYEISSNTFGN